MSISSIFSHFVEYRLFLIASDDFFFIYSVSVVWSPSSYLILLIFILSLCLLDSLAWSLSNLLIFSRKYLLILLILCPFPSVHKSALNRFLSLFSLTLHMCKKRPLQLRYSSSLTPTCTLKPAKSCGFMEENDMWWQKFYMSPPGSWFAKTFGFLVIVFHYPSQTPMHLSPASSSCLLHRCVFAVCLQQCHMGPSALSRHSSALVGNILISCG